MKRLAFTLVLSGFVISGTAAAPLTCKAKATWKKLAGAEPPWTFVQTPKGECYDAERFRAT
jgi:hypothetical protein